MSGIKSPWWHRALVHLVLVATIAVTLYPILQILSISLRPGDKLYSTSLNLIPDGATLAAYRTILFERDFLLWLRNSLVVSLAVTLVSVALAASAGYAFSRFRFPGDRTALLSFLLTQMFPATMLFLPLWVLLKKLGLLNSFQGLIIVYVTTALPFCVWTMKGYFDSIPRDLEEAALIDGLSPFGAFTRIVLPLSLPALTITALFSFMAAWSEFIVARKVLVDQKLYTLPLGLEALAGTFQTEWANYAAGSVLVSVPVVVLFLLLNRFLVSGLTLGGVKG